MSQYTGRPWGLLLKRLQAEAPGDQEESLGIATNGEDAPNQEILLQRFQSNPFFVKERRPMQLQQKLSLQALGP